MFLLKSSPSRPRRLCRAGARYCSLPRTVPGPRARSGSKSASCCRGPAEPIGHEWPVPIAIGSTVSGNLSPGRSRFLPDPAEFRRSSDRQTHAASSWPRAPALDLRRPGQPARSERRPVVRAAEPADRSACRRGDRLPRGAEPLRLGNLLAFDVIDAGVRPGSNPGAARQLPGEQLRADRRRRLHQQRHPRHRGPGRGPPGDRRRDVSGPLRDPRARRSHPGARRRSPSATSTTITTSTWPSPSPAPTASRSPWATATARSSRRRRSACRSPARPTRSWRATSATATPTWRSPSPTRRRHG